MKVHRVGVTDEAKAYDFFRECRLLKSQLQEWRDMWKDRPLGQFATQMLEVFEVGDPNLRIQVLRLYLRDLHEELADKIKEQMKKILCEGHITQRGYQNLANISMRFDNDAEVYIALDWDAYNELWDEGIPALPPYEYKAHDFIELSLEQTVRFGIYNIDQPELIDMIPRVQRSQTPLDQLERLFEHYRHDYNVPMYYNGFAIVFHIPPILHPNLQRFVAMSATLNPEHAKRAFPNEKDITVIETPYTKLVDGATIFQIRTGAYPRKTLLESETRDGDVVYTGMRDRCKQFFDYIEKQLKREEYNHAVITFLSICNWISTDWMDDYPSLMFFDNFDNIEGLSDVFDDVQCLWIIGTPELGGYVIQQHSKAIYGTDEKELIWDRTDRVFVDSRVQSVYESLVAAKLQQAVGRVRLNRYPKKVFIFSNVFIPSVSDREECVRFDFEDCELTDSVNELEWRVRQREIAEENAQLMEEAILERLLMGKTGYALINEGFPRHLVKRMEAEHQEELARQREREKLDEKLMFERIYENNKKSIRAVARSTGRSPRYIKKVLEL